MTPPSPVPLRLRETPMSHAAPPTTGHTMHIYEVLLRLCAAEDPKPWYPRAFARSAVMPQPLLYYHLENLWLDGLVQKAEGTSETGPGMTLTPLGREVLDDPAALQRLREGRPVVEGSRGGIVREAIRRPPRPTVTYGLLAVILAVFGYGLLLAMFNGVGAEAYLLVGGQAKPLYEKLGALLQGDDLVRGEWWRLATSCFVHLGVLNTIFAMFFLYRVGARAEQMWGAWRVLLIYVLSGIGGNCVGVALQPQFVMPGAWGAVYGLLGAAAVWVVCNDRCLPRAVVTRMRTNVALDAVLFLLFFAVYSFDRWQDLSGAAVGAAVGLVFQAQRFGPSPWRWAALAAMVPLPWLGYTFIRHEMATNPEWAAVIQQANAQADEDDADRKSFSDTFVGRINREASKAFNVLADEGGVLDQTPAERKPATVEKVKRDLHEQLDVMKQLNDDLTAHGPCKDALAESARQAAIRYAQASAELLLRAEKCLREGTDWTDQDQSLIQKCQDACDAWRKLLK